MDYDKVYKIVEEQSDILLVIFSFLALMLSGVGHCVLIEGLNYSSDVKLFFNWT